MRRGLAFIALCAPALGCVEAPPRPATPLATFVEAAPTSARDDPHARIDPPPLSFDPRDFAGFRFASNGALVLGHAIAFEPNRTEIGVAAEGALEAPLRLVTEHREITLLRIEGHSGNDGPEELNRRLTAARAMAVARWLVAHRIDCHRLRPVGIGSDGPVCATCPPADNRRIEFHVERVLEKAVNVPPEPRQAITGDPCLAP